VNKPTGLHRIIGTATIQNFFHLNKYTAQKAAHWILAPKTTPFT